MNKAAETAEKNAPGYDPAAELEQTKGLLEIKPEIPVCAIDDPAKVDEIWEGLDVARAEAAEEFDGFELRGKKKEFCNFDPARHKAKADGSAHLGSKDQFLLRTEAKKTLKARVSEFGEKVKNAISLEKNDIPPEISEKREIPLSDHELEEIEAKKAEHEAVRQAAQEANEASREARHAELTASAENGADLFFVGGSMLLGVEFLNGRDRHFDRVSKCIYEYEKRTGKTMDLPPGVALAMGLGRIGYEIARTEPECKKRLDSGVAVIRKNAGSYIKTKIPGFCLKKSAPVAEVAEVPA